MRSGTMDKERQEKEQNMKTYTKNSKKVKEKLRDFCYATTKETGVSHISGGYAVTEIYDTDDEYFYIILKWGVQSDCEDSSHRERYLMNRKTLELEENTGY